MTDTASAQLPRDPAADVPALVAHSVRRQADAQSRLGELPAAPAPHLRLTPATPPPLPAAPPAPAAPPRAHSPLLDGPLVVDPAAAQAVAKIREVFSEIARHIHLAEQIVPARLGTLRASAAVPADFDLAAAESFLAQATALLDAFKPRTSPIPAA